MLISYKGNSYIEYNSIVHRDLCLCESLWIVAYTYDITRNVIYKSVVIYILIGKRVAVLLCWYLEDFGMISC